MTASVSSAKACSRQGLLRPPNLLSTEADSSGPILSLRPLPPSPIAAMIRPVLAIVLLCLSYRYLAGGDGDDSVPLDAGRALPSSKPFPVVVHRGPPLSLAQKQGRSGANRVGGGRDPPRILALGGSVTWGGGCLRDPGGQAYPHVLGRLIDGRRPGDEAVKSAGAESSVVHNLGLRGSGAFFPSMCVNSMVRERLQQDRGTSGHAVSQNFDPPREEDDDPDYDVILLEFSLNGVQGLRMLLWRLRRRYPSAVLMFVHLRTQSEKRGKTNASNNKSAERIASLMREVGGTMWELDESSPKEEDGLFCSDGLHINASGHDRVARGLFDALTDPDPAAPPQMKNSALRSSDVRPFMWASPPVDNEGSGGGTWGLGDMCHLWYHTGAVPPSVSASGGKVNLFNAGQQKFAYELPSPSGSERKEKVEFEFDVGGLDPAGADKKSVRRRRIKEVPVYLTHMTYGTPGMYPAVDVEFTEVATAGGGDEARNVADAPVAAATRTRIDPSHARDGRNTGLHLTEMAEVGKARPGVTVRVSVSNAAKMDGHESSVDDKDVDAAPALHPFRIIGLSACGACVEMGFDEYATMGLRYCRKEKCFV